MAFIRLGWETINNVREMANEKLIDPKDSI
jgi:hypothetical protein